MTATGNLFAQQEANRKASRRLVAGFIIFVAWLGFGGDIIWFLASRNSENPGALHVFPGIGILLSLVAVGMAWAGYNFGATMLMKASSAREIDTPSTDAEQRLWQKLKRRQIATVKFRRQQPIGPFIVDFVCFQRRLIIEVDGAQHGMEHQIVHDEQRTRWLETQGYRVLRFWTHEIRRELNAVLDTIYAAISEKRSLLGFDDSVITKVKDHPTPALTRRPSPSRGG